jgi:60 kDa SS-A/Ro ribonucleoprotein
VSYLKQHGTRSTSQRQPMRADQVANEAGGYVWEIDKWAHLRRFLILGTEGGSYYATEYKMTKDAATTVRACLKEDGLRTVNEIVEISQKGRAPRNDPALFALACAISAEDKETRRAAAEALPKVARIGTHLYHFVDFAETMRGWGRTMRWAVSNWYDRNPEQLALQAVKYRQRDGWSHRDLLRLAHPKNDAVAPIFDWITHRDSGQWPRDHMESRASSDLIGAFESAQRAESPKETAALVREYRLPREALQTEHLNDPEVWRAMLDVDMPMTAMLRNLATMTRAGIFESAEYRKIVISAFENAEILRKSRLHPMSVLIGMTTYAQGHGFRSTNTWQPVVSIVNALDTAFYGTFGNVEPTGKNILCAVDASGSMYSGQVAGAPGMPPVMGAMAMALVMTATEPDLETVLFDQTLSGLPLSSRQRLDDVMKMHPGHGRGTDVALPMRYAIEYGKRFDGIVIISDMQTWAGYQHPAQALTELRERSGIPVRLASIAMIANRWQVADPKDALSFEAVGFDTATPELVSGFIAGEF